MSRAKALVEKIPVLNALLAHVASLASLIISVVAPQDSMRERSQRRWRMARPDKGLTLGTHLSGDDFIARMTEHVHFDADKSLIEIGPGYGRLLQSILEMKVPFRSYIGLDISPINVQWLESQFGSERIRFVLGDAETADLKCSADTVFSSLTFQHFYPDFRRTLINVQRHILPHGLLVFDLIERSRFWPKGFFEPYTCWTSYVRSYNRPNVREILKSTGFELVVFDTVRHAPGCIRLLIVARRQNL